jgi:hypothetical protein
VNYAVNRPFRASFYGDINLEAEKIERMTTALGSAEAAARDSFGYKSA